MLTPRGVLTAWCLVLWAVPGQLTVASRLLAYNGEVALPAEIHGFVARLANAPVALRADFALAALSELIVSYRREAQRARAEMRRGEGGHQLSRWARAVEGMVADLQRLADGLSPDTPVWVSALYPGTVYLIVDGNPVLLTGPRQEENAALERRVLQRFCSRNDCSDLLEEEQVARPTRPRSKAAPVWRFGDAAGPVCASGDGLELQFQNASKLNAKREACSRIVAELNSLATALRRELSKGIRVDWNRLAIRPVSGADVQHIVLNRDGDYLLISVPSLEQSQELFRLVLPWLAAKVAGTRYNLVVLNTERLLMLPVGPAD